MIIVTTNEVAGYQIVEVLGETMGTVAYSSYGMGGLGGSGFSTLLDLTDGCRAEAMRRLWLESSGRGANAVVGMRYDLGQLTEYVVEACAYGTAVVLRPLGEGEPGATPQSIRQAVRTNGRPASPEQPPPSDLRAPTNRILGTLPPEPSTGHRAPPPPPNPPAPQGPPPGNWQQPPAPDGYR